MNKQTHNNMSLTFEVSIYIDCALDFRKITMLKITLHVSVRCIYAGPKRG